MRYFAYGSNLEVARMARRCPLARLVDRATLSGARFIITSRGYAGIVPAAGSVVLGVLWDLAASDEAALDRYEGVRDGLYRRERRTVTTTGGRSVEAMVYVAAHADTGPPNPGYLETIVAAARAHGFPDPYVAQLESWFPPGP